MPITEETTLALACDNPDCPAKDDPTKLPEGVVPTERAGWLFITGEFYGQPVFAHVCCCGTCASEVFATIAPIAPVVEEVAP